MQLYIEKKKKKEETYLYALCTKLNIYNHIIINKHYYLLCNACIITCVCVNIFSVSL
jgi:hypothetical protein